MKPYYQDEAVTIYNADCREVLPTLESADLVLTDPPYANGTPYDSYEDTPDNLQQLIVDVLPDLRRVGGRVLITPGVANVHSYPKPDWTLAWFTPAGIGSGSWGFCCWQPVLAYGTDPYLAIGGGRRPDAFVMTRASETNGHPCPKPIEVMRWLIARGTVAAREVVLDPFMGSGSTLRAAKDLGRRVIGIETSERYCEIARRRMAQEVLPLEAATTWGLSSG